MKIKLHTVILIILFLNGFLLTNAQSNTQADSKRSNEEVIHRIKTLVDNGSSIEAIDSKIGNGGTVIFATVFKENEFLEYLITKGANVNNKDIEGYTALMFAVINSNYRAMKLLIKAGSKLEERTYNAGATAYIFADSNKNTEAMRILQESGAIICKGCRTYTDLKNLK